MLDVPGDEGCGGPLRRTLMYRDLVGQATTFALACWEGPGVLLTTKCPGGAFIVSATSVRALSTASRSARDVRVVEICWRSSWGDRGVHWSPARWRGTPLSHRSSGAVRLA